MLKLKTRWFHKWAKKKSVSDDVLSKAVDSINNDLNVVNLGSGLYKVRTPKTGLGKSGGYRTLVVYKELEKAIFVYGFSKAERDNLSVKELRTFKTLSKDLLQISEEECLNQVKSGLFIKLE